MPKRKSPKAKRTAQPERTPPVGSGRLLRYIGVLLVLAAVGAVLLSNETAGPRAPSRTAPTRAHVADKSRLRARVGDIEITSTDLERYSIAREAPVGDGGERQLLAELCDRTLLDLLAAQDRIEISDENLQSQVMRRRLVLGVTASAAPDARDLAAGPLGAEGPGMMTGVSVPRMPGGFAPSGGAPGIPDPFHSAPIAATEDQSPLERVERLLASHNVSEKDFVAEVRADALAQLVKEARVYSKIEVTQPEVLAAWRAEPSQTRGPKTPSKEALEGLRQRIRHQRGAPGVAALLAELRTRWKVELIAR